MRDRGRWQLTGVQRLLLGLSLVTAVFLSAMSLGMGSIGLVLIAIVLLVVAGLGVFLLGLRYAGQRHAQGSAHVIMVPPPPVGAIVGRLEMRVLVDLGGGSRMVKLRDPSVPVIKWPRVGSVLPVEVDPRNPRSLRVRWEMVSPNQPRVAGAGEESVPLVPFYTDYAEGVAPPQYVPSDPVAVETYAGDTYSAEPDAGSIYDDGAYLGDTARTPGVGYDADAVPATGDQPGSVSGGIPQPRAAEPPGDAPVASGAAAPSPATLAPADVAAAPGISIMLIVADLTRSLAFYRDLLDFGVVDSTAGGAVLAYGGGRIVLSQVKDMSPVDRRVVHLHIQVSDVEAAYQQLRAKGVEFVHRPRVMSRGDRLELWAATFRDPDGHAIALTQWRERHGVPHQT